MTKINLIQIEDDGTMLIRYKKSDGTYHRTSIPAGIDAERQMDEVDTDLLRRGETRVTVDGRELLTKAVAIARAQKV